MVLKVRCQKSSVHSRQIVECDARLVVFKCTMSIHENIK